MILDKQAIFSDQQAITGDAVSANVIDLGAPGTPVGAAAPIQQDVGKSMIPLLIQATEDFNNLTSLTIDVQTDSDEGFGTAVTVMSVTVLLADLVAGYISPIVWVPRGVSSRYMRLNYNVNGTDPTTGKITAGVAAAVESNG